MSKDNNNDNNTKNCVHTTSKDNNNDNNTKINRLCHLCHHPWQSSSFVSVCLSYPQVLMPHAAIAKLVE